MKQTPVCGIDGNLADASNSALGRLLDQFGRNGPLSSEQIAKQSEIEAILQSRRASGVVICDQGFHHPV